MASAVADLQSEEINLHRLLARRIPTRIMIDVGAHHGTTLAPFAEAGWSVIAFEPFEANRRALTERFAAAPAVVVRPEAVSDESGTRALHLAVEPGGRLHEYYHSLERIGEDAYHRKGGVVAVPTVRLDELVRRGELSGRVGFLKVDTEGHDLAVLRGAAGLVAEVISVEFWCDGLPLGRSPSPPRAMIELLTGRGYAQYLVIAHRGTTATCHASRFDGLDEHSWGNILFFHPDVSGLFPEVVREARRRLAQGPRGPRAVRLLSKLKALVPLRWLPWAR